MNPRQGFKFFRFFALDTNCLQIVDYKTSPSLLREDLNLRKAENSIFRNRSICHIKGFEPRDIPTDEGELNVSFWHSGDDYFLYTQDEMDEYLSQQNGMKSGGMS